MFARIQETVIRKSSGRYEINRVYNGDRSRIMLYDHQTGLYTQLASLAEVESYLK